MHHNHPISRGEGVYPTEIHEKILPRSYGGGYGFRASMRDLFISRGLKDGQARGPKELQGRGGYGIR